MAGQGAAYSGSWQNVGTFGVTHAIGYATSESWGRRGVEAKSAQDLHDSTVQATDFVRSLNSTVIVQGTQAERHQLETRTITNHNQVLLGGIFAWLPLFASPGLLSVV